MPTKPDRFTVSQEELDQASGVPVLLLEGYADAHRAVVRDTAARWTVFNAHS